MKIYISNLSNDVTEENLQTTFKSFGQVTLYTKKYRKESKRFGIANMPDRAEAELAILSLNGKNLKGKPLKVGFFLSGSKGHRDGGQKSGNRRSAGDKVGGTRGGKRNF